MTRTIGMMIGAVAALGVGGGISAIGTVGKKDKSAYHLEKTTVDRGAIVGKVTATGSLVATRCRVKCRQATSRSHSSSATGVAGAGGGAQDWRGTGRPTPRGPHEPWTARRTGPFLPTSPTWSRRRRSATRTIPRWSTRGRRPMAGR